MVQVCIDVKGWESDKMKKNKNYKFVVVVCCQGQPFYYYKNTLLGALFEYAKQYIKKNKYGTMNFTLRQEFDSKGE